MKNSKIDIIGEAITLFCCGCWNQEGTKQTFLLSLRINRGWQKIE
jgi:hypothetical protein